MTLKALANLLGVVNNYFFFFNFSISKNQFKTKKQSNFDEKHD
jgi:hypothetical protein